ncbi:hypothetical protein SAMN02745866_02494 [Alteromonadaceae bacterium Bs31]|nr:hypothetical protein SAMN02745866_02494 [Alteromonadaceae bacterium Bs31]
MSRTSIADAVVSLEELLAALTNAYWDTSNLERKDCIFDLVTSLFAELNELTKLSVEDHSMNYEPITFAFHSSTANLKNIQNNIDLWFPRASTAKQLQDSIPSVAKLFEFV